MPNSDEVPYQTLIARVLHKYLTGRLAEQPGSVTKQARTPSAKRRTPSPS